MGLAATLESGAYKALVNAVLRRVAREGDGLWQGADRLRLNVPGWLWESWVSAYGEDAARIAAAHLVEAPLDITVRNDAASGPSVFTGSCCHPARCGAPPVAGSRRCPAMPTVHGGCRTPPPPCPRACWATSRAFASPISAPRRAARPCSSRRPARVTAVDVSAKRLRRVAENLKRTGLAAELVAADGAAWRPDSPPDAVLLDAPCSATGTLRRHPDIAWLKSADDVERLVAVQARLLDSAIAMVKPGGLVVYAVCSLQPQESHERVAAVVARGAVRREPLTPADVPGLPEAVSPDGDLRTLPSMWPDWSGLDGFYAARLRRMP